MKLFKPLIKWPFSSLQRFKVELLLCIAMTVLGAIYSLLPDLRQSLQSIFFVPVVISAVLLGWKKSSAFTVIGVILVICVSGNVWSDRTPGEFLRLLLWACTLGTTGAIIGLLVSAKEKHVSEILEKHNSLALTDQLTQVANRRGFDVEMRRRMTEIQRNDRDLSMLMIDIDFFKKFNDRYGHATGDIVLQTIANTIQKCLRESDLVARYGGEEFAVLLPDTNVDEANVVAERIRYSVDQISESDVECPQKVSVSIGLTEVETCDDTCTVLERADIAMYAAKRNGRNQVFVDRSNKIESKPRTDANTQSRELINIVFDEAQSMQSEFDTITGLTYLQIFNNELTRRVYESARYGMDLCLALITVGQSQDASVTQAQIISQVGNIGRTLKNGLRESDVITWYSECEFGIMLPFTRMEDGKQVLRRLFFEINTDLLLEEETPFFHVQSLRIVQAKAGDTRKQILKNLRNATPIDDAEISTVWS